MPIETVRFDLGDGDFAEIYVKLRHGTTKQIMEIYRPFMNTPEIIAQLDAVMEDRASYISKLKEIVGLSADHMGANDALILGQVKAWSFGEVTQDVLDDLPEDKIAIILEEADRRYGEIPLARSGAGR